MAQQQGNRDNLWRRRLPVRSDRSGQPVELIADVQFVQQHVQQSVGPRHPARTCDERPQNLRALVGAPVLDVILARVLVATDGDER
jgi:hypothetical protein